MRSWRTTDNFLKDAVDVDWTADDDDEQSWQPQQKRLKRPTPVAAARPPSRFRYFADRQLELVTEF